MRLHHAEPTAEYQPWLFPHLQLPGKSSSPEHQNVLTVPFLGEKRGMSTHAPLYSTNRDRDTHTHTRCQHTHIPEDSHMGIRWQKRLIAINVHSSVRTSVKWTLWLKALSKSQPRRARVERTKWEGPPFPRPGIRRITLRKDLFWATGGGAHTRGYRAESFKVSHGVPGLQDTSPARFSCTRWKEAGFSARRLPHTAVLARHVTSGRKLRLSSLCFFTCRISMAPRLVHDTQGTGEVGNEIVL